MQMQEKLAQATKELTLDDLEFVAERLRRCAVMDLALARRHRFGLQHDELKAKQHDADATRANALADTLFAVTK